MAKKKRRRPPPNHRCPIHNTQMPGNNTRYGWRYACPEIGCTVVAWGRNGPADQATREARIAAHAALDPLWKLGGHERSAMYAGLAHWLSLTQEACHIAMFSVDQCAEVLKYAEAVDGKATD